jgi:integrase
MSLRFLRCLRRLGPFSLAFRRFKEFTVFDKNVFRRMPSDVRRSRWVLNKLAAKNPLSEWVFESRKRNGENAPSGDVKRAWEHALKVARITDFRFHDLRHTFASHFAMKRGDLYALAEILGHSNPKITLDRYAHLSPEFVHAQRGVIDAMYSNSLTNGHQMDSGRKTASREYR